MSKKPVFEGRGEKPNTSKPDINEGRWEKEFEDEIYVTDMIHGTIMPYNSGRYSLSDLFEKYLGCDYKLEIEKGKRKVKIKCKDGCIQIERIGQ